MSIEDRKDIAEALRVYLAEHLPGTLIPVPRGHFSLDGLLEDRPSMSLQVVGGGTKKTYLDGAKIKELSFNIYYRAFVAQDNAEKGAMLGVLNGIGEWMDNLQEPPYLGPEFTILKLEQTQEANIAAANLSEASTLQHITYMAGFALGYETKGRY